MPNFDMPKPAPIETPEQMATRLAGGLKLEGEETVSQERSENDTATPEVGQEYITQECIKNVQQLLARLENYRGNVKRYEQIVSVRSKHAATLTPEDLSDIDGGLRSIFSEMEKDKKYVDILAEYQTHITGKLLGKPADKED